VFLPHAVVAVVALITAGILFTGSVIIVTYCRMTRHNRRPGRSEHDLTSTPLMNSVHPVPPLLSTFQACHVTPSRQQYDHQFAVLEAQPSLGLFFSDAGERGGGDRLLLFDNRCGRTSALGRGGSDRIPCQDYRELIVNREKSRDADEKNENNLKDENGKIPCTRTYSKNWPAPPPDVAINVPSFQSPRRTTKRFSRDSCCSDVNDTHTVDQNCRNEYCNNSCCSSGSRQLQLKHTYEKC